MRPMPMFRRVLNAVAMAGVLSFASAAQASHLLDWICIDLGLVQPAGSSGAMAVTNRGDVAGWFTPTSGGTHGFLWSNGTFRDLGAPAGRFDTFVNDMNPGETVVGISGGQAAMWKDGAWSLLGFAGEARAIGRNGDVAGNVIVNAVERGVLLRDGVLTDIGTLTGIAARINAMNDADHIVGRASLADGTAHAFLWADGGMRDLGALDRRNSIATAINNRNVVVGFAADSITSASEAVGFVWYGRMFRLLPQYSNVVPFAINDRSDIVGRFGDGHAFLLADGQLVKLDTLPAVRAAGFIDLVPRAISERRWIVGEGIVSSGPAHAFLLMPGEPISAIW